MQQWTSAAEELQALRRASAVAGCAILSAEERDTPHGRRAVARVRCRDGWGAARFLLACSLEDAATAGCRMLALDLWRGASSDEEYVRAVFEFVKDRVRFVREAGEVFARGDYTLASGSGDCDDHARPVFALLAAGGIPAALAFLYRKGDKGPRHVVALAMLGGRWVWLETTVDAFLGEHPYAAAERLGILKNRTDIATEVRIMTEKDLPPVPPGFNDRTTSVQLTNDVIALQRLGFLCRPAHPQHPDDPTFRQAVAAFQRSVQHGNGHGLVVDGNIGDLTRAELGTLPVRRQFTHAMARDALHRAYSQQFGREPSEGELDFGLATAYFETFYGRGTGAAWGDGGQFGRWASEGKINWGALQSGSPSGDPRFMASMQKQGLHPTLEQGKDAGRPVYFYLFPDDVEAARAFLMSWGQADTLAAASTGSANAVAAAMKRHGYYEGFHVGPGKLGNKKSPPFIEESDDATALEKNVRDYASALSRNVGTVRGTGGVPDAMPTSPSSASVAGTVVALLLVASTIGGAWWLAGRS